MATTAMNQLSVIPGMSDHEALLSILEATIFMPAQNISVSQGEHRGH